MRKRVSETETMKTIFLQLNALKIVNLALNCIPLNPGMLKKPDNSMVTGICCNFLHTD